MLSGIRGRRTPYDLPQADLRNKADDSVRVREKRTGNKLQKTLNDREQTNGWVDRSGCRMGWMGDRRALVRVNLSVVCK